MNFINILTHLVGMIMNDINGYDNDSLTDDDISTDTFSIQPYVWQMVDQAQRITSMKVSIWIESVKRRVILPFY